MSLETVREISDLIPVQPQLHIIKAIDYLFRIAPGNFEIVSNVLVMTRDTNAASVRYNPLPACLNIRISHHGRN